MTVQIVSLRKGKVRCYFNNREETEKDQYCGVELKRSAQMLDIF